MPDIPEEAVEAAASTEYFNDLTLGGQMSCKGDEWAKTAEQVRHGYIASAERMLAAAYPLLRQQIESRFHVPQIAEHRDGWGVFCAACSAAAGDYVFPCHVDHADWWARVPSVLVARGAAQPGGTE